MFSVFFFFVFFIFIIAVCLPDDPEGNAKLMLSILDCLPRANRVRIYTFSQNDYQKEKEKNILFQFFIP